MLCRLVSHKPISLTTLCVGVLALTLSPFTLIHAAPNDKNKADKNKADKNKADKNKADKKKADKKAKFTDSKGQRLSRKKVLKLAQKARLVYVGEEHGHKQHHLLQRDILKAMAKKGPVVLGVEYFPKSLQPVLNDFHKGKISLEDFPKAINWTRTWGHKYEHYYPLFKLCKEQKIRILALNAERSVVRQVGRKGLKSFSVEELLQMPHMDFQNKAHRKRIEDQLQSVHPMPKDMLKRYYQAFTLWDEHMAETLIQYFLRDRRSKLRALVVAGRAHIETGTGIPDRAHRRMPARRLIVVCDSSGKGGPELGDVVYHSPPRPKKKAESKAPHKHKKHSGKKPRLY